jgi:hypothetical protein
MKNCYLIINKEDDSWLFVAKLKDSYDEFPEIEDILWPVYHHMSKTKCEYPYEDENFIIYRGPIYRPEKEKEKQE